MRIVEGTNSLLQLSGLVARMCSKVTSQDSWETERLAHAIILLRLLQDGGRWTFYRLKKKERKQKKTTTKQNSNNNNNIVNNNCNNNMFIQLTNWLNDTNSLIPLINVRFSTQPFYNVRFWHYTNTGLEFVFALQQIPNFRFNPNSKHNAKSEILNRSLTG